MSRSPFASFHRARTDTATDRLRASADRLRLALELRYDPEQPRHPAGTSEGGRWSGSTSASNDDSGFAERDAVGESNRVDSRVDDDEQRFMRRQLAPPRPEIVAKSHKLKDETGSVVKNIYGNEILIPKNYPIEDVERSIRNIKMDINSSDMAYFGLVEFAMGLLRLRTWGEWDAQRLTGAYIDEYRDFATVVIGYYGGSIGLPENSMLDLENNFAKYFSKFSKHEKMDSKYKYLPTRNVYNTKIGYDLAARR